MADRLLCPHDLLGQAEIHDLCMALTCNHDVGWLEVPVDDLFFMGLFDSFCNLSRKVKGLWERQRASVEPFPERIPFDVLHNYVVFAFRLANFVNAADVRRMIQRRRRPGFALETHVRFGIALAPDGRTEGRTC
jgi:hypothetical protein